MIITIVFSVFGASRLEIRSALTDLLPEHFDSVKNIKKLEEIYGGIGQLILIVETRNPAQGEKYIMAAAQKLKKHPEVRYIQYQKPIHYLEKYKFLFMDYKDLKKIYARAKNKIDYVREKNNPLALGLEKIKDPGFDISDLRKKYEGILAASGIKKDIIKRPKLINYNNINKKNKNRNKLSASEKAKPPKKPSDFKNDALYWNQDQEDPTLYRFVILIKPQKSATDVTYTNSIIKSLDKYLNDMNPKSYDPSIEIKFAGKYKKNIENLKLISGELKKTSIIAFVLILISIGLYFRRFRAIFYIFFPLIIGILFTFGVTGFIFGYLNLITSFLVAILLGLGIDHGIHIYSRYIEERISGKTQEEALRITITETGLASTIAGLTTSIAFFGLMASKFNAFFDFGFIAGLGILFCLFSIIILFPILVRLYEKWRDFPQKDILLYEVTESDALKKLVLRKWLWLILPLTILLAYGSTRVSFNYNFKKLETSDLPSYVLEDKIRNIFSLSFSPTVLIPKNKNDAARITRGVNNELSRMKKEGYKPTIETAKSISSLIPEEQKQKIGILKKIKKLIKKNKKYFHRLDKKTRKFLNNYKKSLSPGYLTLDKLPDELKEPFTGAGKYNELELVLLFPNISLSDGRLIQKMNQDLNLFQSKIGGFEYASDALILADIITLIQTDGLRILVITLLAVFILIQINLDSIRQSLWVMTPLLFGLIWLLGIMGLVNLQFNILNIIILPIVVGIGIDNGVHFFHRFKEDNRYDSLYALRHAGKPLTMTTLTTIIGFSSLIMANHYGLRTMGVAIVIGLLTVYISAMWVVPVLLTSFAKKH